MPARSFTGKKSRHKPYVEGICRFLSAARRTPRTKLFCIEETSRETRTSPICPRCLRGVEKSGSRFTWKRLASEFRLPPDAMPHAPTPRALRAYLKRKSRETNSSCSACKVLLVRKKSDNRPVECIRRSSVCRRTPVRRSLWASRCCSPTQMCAAPC